MPRRSCYLSGKMRGLPEYGFPVFDAAKKLLRLKGWRVVSPADMDRALGFDPEDSDGYDFDINEAFRRDFEAVLKVNAIVLLPNWRDSAGANAELLVAYHIGLPVYLLEGEELTLVEPHLYAQPSWKMRREHVA